MKVSLRDSVQFRKLLIEKGYSQRQFSKEIGVSETYLNQIINMKRHPSPDISKKITEKLQMDFYDLFIIK